MGDEGFEKEGRSESRSVLMGVEREVRISTEKEEHFERRRPAKTGLV